jgi:hypothetical protein
LLSNDYLEIWIFQEERFKLVMALSVLEISSPDDVADAVVSYLLLGLVWRLSLRLKIWNECSFSFKFWESNLNLKKREKRKEKNENQFNIAKYMNLVKEHPYWVQTGVNNDW